MAALLPRLSRRRGDGRREERRFDRWLSDVSNQIRAQLDTEQVLSHSIRGVHRVLRPTRTSIWLTSGPQGPRLARTSDADWGASSPEPSPLVLDCVKRRAPACDAAERAMAAPMATPRSALLGVLVVEGVAEDQAEQRFLGAVARETGLALESAGLYEEAVAAKEKTEAILARVGDCVVVTDPRGEILQWNEAAERIIGRSSGEAIGCSCCEVLALRIDEHPLDCADGCRLLQSRDATDATLGQEVWRLHDDGRRQPLLATVETVTDSEGNVSEVVHSLRDITRLKQADEAKTMFLATASHELKTPLTVIQGFAEVLTSGTAGDEDEKKALEAVRSRAVQLNGIVDRILLSSRIEAGRSEIYCQEMQIEPILRERSEALQASSGREVLAAIGDVLPAAFADPEVVTTVVDHLLDNAVKYSPDGGCVTVATAHDETHVGFSVADQGIGMDVEQLERCFEKFWQAQSSDTRRFGGTGIGLFIVRSLVEAMGGEVRVDSTLGTGTTFSVSLARADSRQPEEAAVASASAAGEPSVIREFMRQIGVPERGPS